jgi:hypothetical protein
MSSLNWEIFEMRGKKCHDINTYDKASLLRAISHLNQCGEEQFRFRNKPLCKGLPKAAMYRYMTKRSVSRASINSIVEAKDQQYASGVVLQERLTFLRYLQRYRCRAIGSGTLFEAWVPLDDINLPLDQTL